MERLTFVDEDGKVLFENPSGFPEDIGFTIRELAENEEWEALDNIAQRLANCEQRLKYYKDLEEQGKLLKLPCVVGDTVYVLAECENIPTQLDGTLWDENGAHGTATGYYCPYEDNCPFNDEDFGDCEKYKGKTAVFEDVVGDITIGEDGIWIRTVNCGVCSQVGLHIFLTRPEAERALAEMEGKK